MRRETDRPLYVYALSAPGLPRRFTVLGRRLRAITIGAIDVIVGQRAPDRSIENIQRQHEIITALAARTAALLPARFGSEIGEDALRSLVSDREADLRSALKRVRNCQQMTIRVFGRSETGAVPDVLPRTGAEYMARRRARALREPPEAAVIRAVLSDLIRAERVEPGERGIRVTVFHLVATRRLTRYRQRASAIQSSLTAASVTVTGPWPPFAFAPELF
jgi:hypothetical protein